MILVDWGNGSGFPYNQATANTRVVGAEVAVLVSSLNRVLGTTNSQYHLIGHSLGAHIAGYAGSRLPGLGRITGNQYYWILSWDLNYPDELFIIGLRVRKKYYTCIYNILLFRAWSGSTKLSEFWWPGTVGPGWCCFRGRYPHWWLWLRHNIRFGSKCLALIQRYICCNKKVSMQIHVTNW